MVAHRLARDETVRICLGGAFTKDTGQRNLVRRAEKVIAIEGCFIHCAARMMEGVLPDLSPVIVQADMLYDSAEIPFGIDEMPDEMFTVYAYKVAEQVVREHVKAGVGCAPERSGGCGPAPERCGCGK
jgi:hypothetical protein